MANPEKRYEYLVKEHNMKPSQQHLLIASYADNLEVIDFLINEYKILPNISCFNNAALKGNVKIMKYLLKCITIDTQCLETISCGTLETLKYLINTHNLIPTIGHMERICYKKSIESVIYPGLKSHTQHKLAIKQQLNPEGEPIFGSIISIKVSSVEKRDSFLEKIKLFTLAESLGGVESLVSVPYDMTHVSVPVKTKEQMGLTKTLIRLSVGIENIDDLYSDLLQALED